ncbi:unnamed protein product, partial [Polarella glacialis]
ERALPSDAPPAPLAQMQSKKARKRNRQAADDTDGPVGALPVGCVSTTHLPLRHEIEALKLTKGPSAQDAAFLRGQGPPPAPPSRPPPPPPSRQPPRPRGSICLAAEAVEPVRPRSGSLSKATWKVRQSEFRHLPQAPAGFIYCESRCTGELYFTCRCCTFAVSRPGAEGLRVCPECCGGSRSSGGGSGSRVPDQHNQKVP